MVQRITTPTEAAAAFRGGSIVIYPTDTVWGVGCVLSNPDSIRHLYELKERDNKRSVSPGGGKPFTVLVSSTKMAKRYGEINKIAEKLAHHFWPGGLTIITEINQDIYERFSTTHGYFTQHGEEMTTIALRIPKEPWLIEVIEELGEGIAGPSANFAGKHPPIGMSNLDPHFASTVDALVDSPKEGNGTSSTIVDTTGRHPKILREGVIEVREIMRVAK